MRAIKNIVVHCTATQPNASVEGIKNYWRLSLGWQNPGYHKIIKANGETVTLANDDVICNGVQGHNSNSVHVSYIGGVTKSGAPADTRTPEQLISMVKVITEWLCKYPNAKVLGHRDFKGVKKACPSFDTIKWWESIGK